MVALYPAQSAIVTQVVNLSKPRRAILNWDTGCGKTVATCELIKRTGARRVLVVCPAIVRQHWAWHLREWARCENVGVCTESKSAAGNRSLKAWNAAAYASDVCDQCVVSYDLLGDVGLRAFDLIVIDELHHIANPTTKQSKLVQALFNRYPAADIVGLSATLAPTEIQQTWNPLRLFEGELKWGKPTRKGKISWSFLERYCEKEKTEFGTAYFGLRPDRADQLRVNMSSVCFPLSRTQILVDLPPLDLHVIEGGIDELIAERLQVCKKLVVLVHHRELVKKIADKFGAFCNPHAVPTWEITGMQKPALRTTILDSVASDSSRTVLLVATHDSLLEGIRILWPDQVLIGEWNGSPGKLMQLLGRFVSVGSNARPQVNLIANDESYSAAQAIAQRAPGMIATGLATTGLEDVAARIDAQVNQSVDWDAIFESATSGDWEDT